MKRLVCLLPALAALLSAQEFRSTLTGRITDPAGLGVPNTKVTVIKTDTNTRTDTVTGPDGNYTAPFLAPGPYDVEAEAPGFKKYVHHGIEIGTNQRIAEDIQLQVGTPTEAVTVTADAPLVNNVTASSGQVITAHEVENLPMNGNTPLALARNALGVIPKQKHLLNEVKPYDTSSAVDISLGGANSGSNEYLLDGVPNMSTAARAGGFSPSMEAVDEVKVELYQADAAYGDTLGGTVNITTKQGTNNYHGSLYEFNQTSALSANQFFLNAAGQQQSVTRSNQYGGTIGGPVRLPKVFNGKDKVFFFLAYEGFKDSSPGVSTSAVPTAAERAGDFSALLALGPSYQLYDPASGVLASGKITRQPLPGNLIPSSRINSIAKAYLQYFPAPNTPGKPDGENNYVVPNPSINNYASWVGRTDLNLGTKDKLFFDMHESSYTNSTADIFHNLATGQFSGLDIWGGVGDDVYVFSPTLVLDTRVGVTRSVANSFIKSAGFDPTTLGFPSYMASYSLREAMPRISFSDSNYAGLSTSPGSLAPFTSIQWFTSVTKVHGRHTLKGGFDFRRYDANSLSPGYSAGTFTFGTNWITAGTGASAPAFGGSMASFLFGLPTAGQFDVNTGYAYRSYLFGYFVQDDIRIKSNLTINLGLRIEHETPIVERYNHIVNGFDPTAVNSVAQAAAKAYAANPLPQLPATAFDALGGLTFALSSNRSGYSLPAFFPSPRVGITWAPGIFHSKTVFRGGFGVFNNSIGAYLTGPTSGFSQTTSLNPSNDSYLTPYATLTDPYPARIQTPVGSALGINTNLAQSISFYDSQITNPYSTRWSFDIQHQFGKDMMLQIGYIGNKQVHGTLSNAISSTPLLPFLSRSPVRDQATINALAQVVPNPFAGLMPAGTSLNGSTLSVATLLQAFPEFSGVTLSNSNPGWGTFNELTVMFQKRFSKGLQATVNYQHSRQLNSYQNNAGDYKLQYGPTSGDYPDHFVITGSYNLPFGRGEHFLGSASKPVDLMIGGWILNSVYTWESGGALSWGNVIYYGGPLDMQPRNLQQAFDVTRFERASAAQLSQNYRTFPQMFNNLRSDAANNVDLSMLKNFHVTERVSVQYRFEAFNAFNRAQFAAPNLTPTSSAFGTITSQANTPRSIQMGLKVKF
ncbi:MAG TPA: carboxypeptidase regulatory-like domain-containing protein [Bryobacteraceae bacterium]|nr:carboxypeptidase regulatory-like domain-containing protein [Bryobacteraceae bacterium]